MRILDQVTRIALIACMATIVSVVFGQIVLRYSLSDVPPWTEELARYVFAWIVFLGTPVAYRHKAHIVIDILVTKLSANLRMKLDVLVLLSLATFLSFMVVQGVQYAWDARGDHSPVLELSMSIFYLPLPVGAALTLVYVLVDLWGKTVRGAT